MNRHADFLPGEADFLLGLLQEVGGLKEFFFFRFRFCFTCFYAPAL